jgi:single-strand DNA-binding protein
MNSVALIGRLTADPTTHAGEKHESATFRLAVPRKPTPTKPEVSPGTPGDASTEKRFTDGADFVDIVCFDKLAATCGEWLTKGREVAVVGKLRLSEWTGRDGERRSKIQVVAEAVDFLGAPPKAKAVDEPQTPSEKGTGGYRRKAS